VRVLVVVFPPITASVLLVPWKQAIVAVATEVATRVTRMYVFLWNHSNAALLTVVVARCQQLACYQYRAIFRVMAATVLIMVAASAWVSGVALVCLDRVK